ncbi:hypothetical protein M569_07941, partial [Genlisea aurea]
MPEVISETNHPMDCTKNTIGETSKKVAELESTIEAQVSSNGRVLQEPVTGEKKGKELHMELIPTVEMKEATDEVTTEKPFAIPDFVPLPFSGILQQLNTKEVQYNLFGARRYSSNVGLKYKIHAHSEDDRLQYIDDGDPLGIVLIVDVAARTKFKSEVQMEVATEIAESTGEEGLSVGKLDPHIPNPIDSEKERSVVKSVFHTFVAATIIEATSEPAGEEVGMNPNCHDDNDTAVAFS